MKVVSYYSPRRRALVHIKTAASPDFWDRQWKQSSGDLQRKLDTAHSSFVTRTTRFFLKPPDGPILEGGCGLGLEVAALRRNGYLAVGLDFARETLALVKHNRPDLPLLVGDVRDLPLGNEVFAGYWSLGVIEHFWAGYESIAREACRVLKRGGYLFVTFPALSPLRKLKIRMGCYPALVRTEEPTGFYQFALDAGSVAVEFKRHGFQVCAGWRLNAVKGLKDEISWIEQPLQHLVSGKPSVAGRIIARLLELTVPLTGHAYLFVFRKSE